jgi:hypothetical protein
MQLKTQIFSRRDRSGCARSPYPSHNPAQEETQMDFGLGLLTFGTFGFVVAFGYLSLRATQKLKDSGAPKSSLSRDGMEERALTARRA